MNRLLKFAAFFSWIAAGAASLATRGDEETESDRPDPASETRSGKSRWKRRLLKLAALGIALAIGGFLVAASGIMPIKASSGHWAITAWFLSFSMERSVATHSFPIEPPPLDEPLLILKGAGHYETGCRPCHGSPTLHHPRIPQAMTPHPPYLPETIPEWESEELFYIVKHGVKFTGMPAWPTQKRDDEVWAVVAFLREFPELSADEYQRLIYGTTVADDGVVPLQGLLEPDAVPGAVLENCARCHGADGNGRGTGAFPRLAGQKPLYTELSLQAFARGERHSGIMEPISAGLSADEIRQVARYYSRLKGLSRPPVNEQSSAAIQRGRAIAHEGIPSKRVPACVSCHGPSPMERNPAYPLLAGQYAEYLELQLELFKKDHRGGTQYAHIMRMVAGHLTTDQMHDVVLYYASLGSGSNGGE